MKIGVGTSGSAACRNSSACECGESEVVDIEEGLDREPELELVVREEVHEIELSPDVFSLGLVFVVLVAVVSGGPCSLPPSSPCRSFSLLASSNSAWAANCVSVSFKPAISSGVGRSSSESKIAIRDESTRGQNSRCVDEDGCARGMCSRGLVNTDLQDFL
jgi:hypothetical protein